MSKLKKESSSFKDFKRNLKKGTSDALLMLKKDKKGFSFDFNGWHLLIGIFLLIVIVAIALEIFVLSTIATVFGPVGVVVYLGLNLLINLVGNIGKNRAETNEVVTIFDLERNYKLNWV